MSRFSAIDLSQLAAPQLIDGLDFETILAAIKADFRGRVAAAGLAYDVDGIETDPVIVALEVAAYRELILRAMVNDKARSALLAFATGSDLDHLAAPFGVVRMTGESDDRLRVRAQIAPEAFASAGPAGAYVFHALSVSTEIAAAAALSPAEGRVRVVLAGTAGTAVSDETLGLVADRLAETDIKPLTDVVLVRRADVAAVPVEAILSIARGPDPATIAASAAAAVAAYFNRRYKVGAGIFRSGLIAALSVGGVDSVDLIEPQGDVLPGDTGIAVAGTVSIETDIV